MRQRTTLQFAGCMLLAILLVAPPALAQGQSNEDSAILIRRTIPYPRAVERAPLTSDQLSTTSTRLIDARRGLRPYSSVRGQGFGFVQQRYSGYDDHFGITRPENRPYSYARRAPRTGVSQFVNTKPDRQSNQAVQRVSRRPLVINPEQILEPRVRVERKDERSTPEPDMTVRVHRNKPELPSRRGAVLILSDGTVIQVGN